MSSAGFCRKAACVIWFWCIFLPFSADAGVMVQKDYVVKQDMDDRIWCELYVVQKNDSLTRIFQEKGGIIDETPEEFLKIFKRINPEISNFENVQPGQQILIPLKKLGPEREISTRIFTLPMVTISASKVQPPSEPKSISDSGGFREYKIKPGDTLSRIFHQYFGISDLALMGEKLRLFYKMNPGISNIHRIHAGQTIRMPLLDASPEENLPDQAGPFESVSAQLDAKLTHKGICYFPMPGKADFRLDLARFPIMEFPDGLRILFNSGLALTNDDQIIILHYWPELKMIDIADNASSDEILARVLEIAPYLRGRLTEKDRAGGSVRSTSFAAAVPSTGRQVFVSGKQQLVEMLMRILGVSYTQNVEMSFPYADIQISSHANWIESGGGKPVLVDFGSFYGDAIQSLEKTGFVVIQILESDSIYQAVPRLLTAIGVSFAMNTEVKPFGLPLMEIPGIWIPREALPSLYLTDAVPDRQTIRIIQEKKIILITEKKKAG